MGLSKLGQAFPAREIMDLVRDDLERVEGVIGLETVASVDAVTTIGRYLQAGGGKRLRPILVLLASRLAGANTHRSRSIGGGGEKNHNTAPGAPEPPDNAHTRPGRPASYTTLC